MLKLTILSVGKTKEKWLEDAVEEYLKRLKPYVEINCIWVKTDNQLLELAKREKLCIGLDPAGRQMSSEEFSDFMMKSWEREDPALP